MPRTIRPGILPKPHVGHAGRIVLNSATGSTSVTIAQIAAYREELRTAIVWARELAEAAACDADRNCAAVRAEAEKALN